MQYFNFFLKYPRFIIFGFINSFFSCLGQTHFIALFNPFLLEKLHLTNGTYSSIYSFATILSGFLLPFLGDHVDSKNLRYFCCALGISMALSTVFFAFTNSTWSLFFSLFLLRLLGQGLFSHVMWTSIARYFDMDRGKALALSSLGFPVSEGLITPLVANLFKITGWQMTLIISALAVSFCYLPLVCFLTIKDDDFNKPKKLKQKTENYSHQSRSLTRGQAFTNLGTYLLLPQALMPPFLLSGLLFHQSIIGIQKGWSIELLGTGFIGYAVGRIILSFFTGAAIDKYSAKKIFPFFLIPMGIGLTFLLGGSSPSNVYGYMVCCGIAVGIGGPVKAALWAEIFGPLHLGAIRSTLGTIIVFATGVSPLLFGYLFDWGMRVETLAMSFIFIMAMTSVIAIFSLEKYFS